jgi:hypothetical protein
MPRRTELAAFEGNALTWFLDEGIASLDELINCDPPLDSEALCPCTVAYITKAIQFASTYKNSCTHRNGLSIKALVESTEARKPRVNTSAKSVDMNVRFPGNTDTSPAAAARDLAKRIAPEMVSDFRKKARITACTEAAPRSNQYKCAGLRSWFFFAENVLKIPRSRCLPPDADDLVAWAVTHRNKGTFTNYLGAVKTACQGLRLDTSAFRDDILDKAKASIQKRNAGKVSSKPGIQIPLLIKLVNLASREGDKRSVAAYVAAYWFSLRFPSEGLPLLLGSVGFDVDRSSGKHLVLGKDDAKIHYDRRKHREHPTVDTRVCQCPSHPANVCPIHALAKYTKGLRVGEKLFPSMTARSFHKALRRRLTVLHVESAASFSSKSFRRGLPRDVSKKKCSWAQLLGVGSWNSGGGMLSYVPEAEEGATVEVPTDSSSSDSSSSSDESDSD